jgi:hypothetical protein
MVRCSTKLLVAVGLFAVLALAAAGPPLDAKEKEKEMKEKGAAPPSPKEAAMEREKAAAAARDGKRKVGENAKRWGGNTRPHAGVSAHAPVLTPACTPPRLLCPAGPSFLPVLPFLAVWGCGSGQTGGNTATRGRMASPGPGGRTPSRMASPGPGGRTPSRITR